MILERVSLKPRSRRRSASSRIRASKVSLEQWTWLEERRSYRRPGVPIKRLGDCSRKFLRS